MFIAKHFSDILDPEHLFLGGKGSSLVKLYKGGFPVPGGFIISTSVFNNFVKENKIENSISSLMKKIIKSSSKEIDIISNKIISLIVNSELSHSSKKVIAHRFRKLDINLVAVRSSAKGEDSSHHAWAGQLDSFLNVDSKNLFDSIKFCWASFFSSRALEYRLQNNLDVNIFDVAVVVQKMVDAEISGVAFSAHPTKNEPFLVIESCNGLGDKLVSGKITPQSRLVNRDTLRPYRKFIINPNLTEVELRILSRLVLSIEYLFKTSVDVEWTKKGDQFYIVQARAITSKSFSKNKLPKLSNYRRLFQVSGIPYLVNDILMSNFIDFSALFLYDGDRWISFLPEEVVEQTKEEGYELIVDDIELSSFNESFKEYQSLAEAFFKKTLQKKVLNKEAIKTFFSYVVQFHTFYIRTEFFYTDKAALKKDSIKGLEENLTFMGDIKNSGRVFLNKIFFGDASYLSKLLSKLSDQFNIPLVDLLQYTQEEIYFLFSNKRISSKNINLRRTAYYVNLKTNELLFGKDALRLISSLKQERVSVDNALSGTVANGGFLSGKVTVIPNRYDAFDSYNKIIDEMDEGNILVAETTSPELMRACQKAGAIITNQGGLLSHAAIFSRELNIPCIVGVDRATDVLKSGMRVELDGETGKIKILD